MNNDLISREALKKHKFTTQVCNGLEIEDVDVVGVATIDNAPAVLTIPDNPTNGDMIKAMFPEVKMWGESEQTLDYSLGGMIHRVTKSWWNAPYEKEVQQNAGDSDNSDNLRNIGDDLMDQQREAEE